MKQLTILIGLLLSVFNLFGQNINFETFYIKTLRHPLQPLPKEIKTYKVNFDPGKVNEINGITAKVNKYLVLDGFELNNTASDVTLDLKFNRFSVLEKKLIRETYTVKENDKEVTKHSYLYQIPYTFTYQFKLINEKTGEAIKELEGEIYKSFTFPTLPANSKAALDKKYALSGREKVTDAERDAIDLVFKQVYDSISNLYGYKWIDERIEIGYPKNKKGKYDDLEQAMNIMKNAILTANENEQYLTDTFISQVHKAIVIWRKALEESSPNKKARVNEHITDLLNYNLAYAYFWLQDYAQCKPFLEAVQEPRKYNIKVNTFNLKGMMKDKERRLLASKSTK